MHGQRRGLLTGVRTRAQAHESVWTIPNMITLARMASAPWLAYLVVAGQYDYAFYGARTGVVCVCGGWGGGGAVCVR